jgi:hypothetical protein
VSPSCRHDSIVHHGIQDPVGEEVGACAAGAGGVGADARAERVEAVAGLVMLLEHDDDVPLDDETDLFGSHVAAVG